MTLVSNQPIDDRLISALQRAATSSVVVPERKPKDQAPPETKLAYASGLNADEFSAFASALEFKGGAGSRLALEEGLLGSIAEWTEHGIRQPLNSFRQYIRRSMMPEAARELITRESVRLHLTGASADYALFPCPSHIDPTENPISRGSIREASNALVSGFQHVCLHGQAGTGKTTALQEVEAALPNGSVMVTYDCYGGGRYLDPSALRHRNQDAFLQITNELATKIRLPLFLDPRPDADYPRLFQKRLEHAAAAFERQTPGALIVIAIDAADNAVNAAQSREERAFTADFVLLEQLPKNVRFMVTSRSGRLDSLTLPQFYRQFEIEPFDLEETKQSVSRFWSVPDTWVEDFHHLSSGIPRVQAYALSGDPEAPSTVLSRLKPNGKSLEDVFGGLFDNALRKAGSSDTIAKLCAGLIALPRPAPLSHLAAALDTPAAILVDICTDLAPGVRLDRGAVAFADEDFEVFVRQKGENEISHVRDRVAEHLLAQAKHDGYSAFNVAGVLFAADHRNELLRLVETEPSPAAVEDPVLRREAELQRLRFAIKVCHEAGNVAQALRFVLIGAEGIKTETALRQLLVDNPDCAARFAPETAGRLILSDAERIEDHGRFLFQKLAVDADQGDSISYREGMRSLEAWLQARRNAGEGNTNPHTLWDIETSDISSMVEAALKFGGPAMAISTVRSWQPKSIAYDIASTLPYRLITKGRSDEVEALANNEEIDPLSRVLLWMPLALAGHEIDVDVISAYLDSLDKTRLGIQLKKCVHTHHGMSSTRQLMLETVVLACEVLTGRQAAQDVVDGVLKVFLDPELRRIDKVPIEPFQFDLLSRGYALAEARAGRLPSAQDLFVPRPEPPEPEKQRRGDSEPPHDEELRSTASVFFGIYAVVAKGIASPETDVEAELSAASQRLESENWRLSPRSLARPLRVLTSIHVSTLLAARHDPLRIKALTTQVHGEWQTGNWVPNQHLVARLGLHPQLHDSLLNELSRVAYETRVLRIGAEEKCRSLVACARMMMPLSEPDARAIFNNAVEVARELDWEATAQIKFLASTVAQVQGTLRDPRKTARRVSNIAADAAIRLEGHDHFPWSEAMQALAQLDTPLALANAARWDQEGKARLWAMLPPVLQSALDLGLIAPEHGVALSLLEKDAGDVVATALTRAAKACAPGLNSLAEEAARCVLLHQNEGPVAAVGDCIRQHKLNGFWASSLTRQQDFLESLPENTSSSERHIAERTRKEPTFLANLEWESETLVDSSLLQDAIGSLRERAREERTYLYREDFDSARSAVSPRDRVRHLEALAGVHQPRIVGDAVQALLDALDEWHDSPAVKNWCESCLTHAIVDQFAALTRYLPYEGDNFRRALARTSCSDTEKQELILRGIEQNVDGLGVEAILALAGKVAGMLKPKDAANLLDWYVARLDDRIPPEHKDQTAPASEIPQQVDEGIARFLFAYMGDCDLRLRWRAAHAVRCLARTGEMGTLRALVAQYECCEENVYRADRGFYWLAARLWFVIAWDRVSGESPSVAGDFGDVLSKIALDHNFPHLLVRAFARDACEKLLATGRLPLEESERERLMAVNGTNLPRTPATRPKGLFGSHRRGQQGDRFSFDPMDTLPYWYEPILRSFANVDMDRFLGEAERWIIDVWGYPGDRSTLHEEQPPGRFGDRNWALTGHRHGSIPTLEELRTHLEWHAMWCAAGEFLKTESLPVHDPQDAWDDLVERVDRDRLSESPLWSADLQLPIPLQDRNWQGDSQELDAWVKSVSEPNHRAEIFPSDVPQYIVVQGLSERSMGELRESTEVASALVEPSTGKSLLRALQSMGLWDYGLPFENDTSREIDQPPYRLLGWLRHSDRDGGIDEKDSFRAYVLTVRCRPGKRVIDGCGLAQDVSGRPCWSSNVNGRPMFRYESWGQPLRDDDHYSTYPDVAGDRLLVEKGQLLEFLRGEGLDLIVEVEVTRRGRESRRHYGEEGASKPEGRFVRLYRLDSRGGLEVAEGCIGTWTDDHQTA